MPPARSIPAGFEEVEGQTDRLLCRVCTEKRFQEITISKVSRWNHEKSNAHQKAVEEMRSQAQPQPSWPSEARIRRALQHQQAQPPQQISVEMPRYDTIAQMLDLPATGPETENHSARPLDHVWFEPNGEVFDDGDRVMFSAGTDPNAGHRQHLAHLKGSLTDIPIYQHALYCDGSPDEFPDDEREDYTETTLRASLSALGVDDESMLEEQFGIEQPLDMEAVSEEWAPYESKTMFMLDMLDSLPRLRLSDDHLRTIIWVMRECGTPDVPAFSQLRKVQNDMKAELKLDPEHHTSSSGRHFYMNHAVKLFALDWSNPLIRPNMQLYPEIDPTNGISEMWHGEKWTKELTENELTPMWCDFTRPGAKHYYVREITEVDNGSFVLPLKWVVKEGAVHAESRKLHYSKTEKAFSFADPGTFYIPATSLRRNILDLQLSNEVNLQFSGRIWDLLTEREALTHNVKFPEIVGDRTLSPKPSLLREKADNRAMFRIQVTVWSDDVSGNVSKQYNPHTNIYLQNLSLPHRNLTQEYFVRFSSTSSHASSSEQFVALTKDFDPEIWHSTYDCKLEEEILFQLVPHVLPADNPQQSEHASHIGGNGLYNCRRDKLGGTDEEKENDEGYTSLFRPGPSRQVCETVESIKDQFRLACYGAKDLVQLAATQTGVKDKISQYWIEVLLAKAQEEQHKKLFDRTMRDPILNTRMKKEERSKKREEIKRDIQDDLYEWIVKQPPESFEKLAEDDPRRTDIRPGDHYSVLLGTRGINPHKDTPVEILHTWLLGNTKYIWHHTNMQWDNKSEQLFAIRLQSSDIAGLTTPKPRANYLVQYKNSLIGKHFKILGQLAVFHLHDLCSDLVFSMWKAAGELGAMLWFPEIHNLEQYLIDLQICIDNVLTIWAEIDPAKIITKVKLHLLTHLVDDIRRFGPAILYSTEVFECWNRVFRLCSILSNHLSPSKDIADSLGGMERFKHVVSGGWWKSGERYGQAGPGVRDMLRSNPELQRRLGWADTSKIEPGTVKLRAHAKRQPKNWLELGLPLALLPSGTAPQISWNHCKHVISRSFDICSEGAWVFFKNGDLLSPGRITKVLAKLDECSDATRSAVVVLEAFSVLPARHPKLSMPVIQPDGQTVVISPLDVLFPFNAQHDCIRGTCRVTHTGFVYQERKQTSIPKPVIVHDTNPVYVINMHSLHNPHLLRQALPRSHAQPLPYCDDHNAQRLKLAAHLRVVGPQKRADTREKAQATRARNKAKKSTTGGAAADPSPSIPPLLNAAGASDDGNEDDDDEPYAEEMFSIVMNRAIH